MSRSPSISIDLLQAIAGPAYFQRGRAYAREGAVELERTSETDAVATVYGSASYRVELTWQDGELDGRCDCPVGARAEFCKHQVATALVWAGLVPSTEAATREPSAPAAGKRYRSKPKASGESETAQIAHWLNEMDHKRLVALTLDLAGRDRDTWRQCVARAQLAAAPEDGRKIVAKLIGRPRFLDYRATLAYARRLEALTDALHTALARNPIEALDLSDYSLHRLFAVYQDCDDSAGAVGEIIGEVARLHRQAAVAVQPDPVAFAKAYFKLRQADDWSVVGRLDAYAEPLARTGLTHLEALAQKRLDALPTRSGSRLSRWDEHESERLSLEALLQELARHGGDIDTLIARKAQAIGAPWDYLDIATTCEAHGRQREAIGWLERGLKAYPKDMGLLDELAQRYHREGFPEEALALRWRAFEQSMESTAYLALKKAAPAADWPSWRERAHAHVERHATQWLPALDQQAMLLMAEDDLDRAWALVEGKALLLSTWRRFAPRIEDRQPQSALRAYRALAEAAVGHGTKHGYAEAVDWLRRAGALHERLASRDELARDLATFRATYRAKRSFIALLNEAFGNLGI